MFKRTVDDINLVLLQNGNSDVLYFCQDNRVTDHRLKMNFELTSFLNGDIESAVQVYSCTICRRSLPPPVCGLMDSMAIHVL